MGADRYIDMDWLVITNPILFLKCEKIYND